jgi:hypothetical protein
MHDLVIRGGTIVDGSGRPPATGDVAIDGSPPWDGRRSLPESNRRATDHEK